jgi:hypothetical protein
VSEKRLPPPGRKLRIVMQCRDAREVTLCENVAFAFARDAGLRALDVWYVAACAGALADQALACGGGELTLQVVDEPRVAIELRACHEGILPAELSPKLLEVRDHMSELRIEWRASVGATFIARKWLQ